ncbi:MAG: hypothetical protein N2544_00610 [Burkholderiales bacterium]|nr:hypothetical protein [Burkholderiales bacterium]
MSRTSGVFVVLALAAAAAGCADTPARGREPEPTGVSRTLNLSGFPVEYRRAFEDGCTAAKRNNPASRPRGDGPEAQGWNDGYAYCRPR